MIAFKRIYVEITNICNKSCLFCPSDSKEKKEMTLEQCERVLKEIKPYTNYIYLHVKGEPLLHSRLVDILKLCSLYGIYVNITTNGSLLYKNVEVLLNSKAVRQINISLHSFKEKTYLENIFKAVDKINGNTSVQIQYRIWAVENNKFSDFDYEIINSIIKHYDLSSSFIKDIEGNKNIVIKDRIYLNKGDLFEWPNINGNIIGENGRCLGTKTHLGILSDGTVIPCCLDSGGIIDLGNIYNQTFSDILAGKRFKEINNGFKNNMITEELCRRCSYREKFIVNK